MSTIEIHAERPDHPQAMAALNALDAYLGSLYEPEANHILSVQELLAPEVGFFVARQGDRIVGTAAVRRMPGEPHTHAVAYGEIKRMYVDPSLRGQGVGVRLLQALEAHMRAQGLTLALLETGRDQHEAVRLYERGGYTQRGAFGGYPDNGLSLFYEKRLA
jgi:putative acetyltransferase